LASGGTTATILITTITDSNGFVLTNSAGVPLNNARAS
jgi:hypothetical protein